MTFFFHRSNYEQILGVRDGLGAEAKDHVLMKKQSTSRAPKSPKPSPSKTLPRRSDAVKLVGGKLVRDATIPKSPPPARKMKKLKSQPAASKKRKVIVGEAGERDDSVREQLYNTGAIGTSEQISITTAQIVSLRAAFLDIDLKHIKKSQLTPAVPRSPKELYDNHVSHWLTNHPVLAKAEVRNSGNGLHVLLMLNKPIEFKNEYERDYWECRIRLIQRALPSDPGSPGIEAKTRPVGEINKKNGATVTRLQEGKPVTQQELEELAAQVCAAPFRTLVANLFGAERVDPCPVCQQSGTYLIALDERGSCYGNKHKVGYEELLNSLMSYE